MGVGGELLAEHVADAGLDVVGIDATLVGGECPYWGCIPTKMMTRAANALAEARRGPHLPRPPTPAPHWSPVATPLPREATPPWGHRPAAGRFGSKGGPVVRGKGRLHG